MDCSELGRDLTALARRGELDPVVGRERETERLLQILSRRTKSNPLLIGDPGVGKTALVDGLARRIVSGAVPVHLKGKRVFELQLGALLAGTQFRGDLEKRVHEFLQQTQAEGTIVFIDEIHLLVQAGRGSGLDAGNLLKPVLARGEISCIGATTPAEARELFAADPAFERRFQPVLVEEPEPAALREILRSAANQLETFHGLSIGPDAIEAALEISMADRDLSLSKKNPDRALDLLEDACAAEQLRLSRDRAGSSTNAPDLAEFSEEVAAATAALDLERHVKAREAYETAMATWTVQEVSLAHSPPILSAEHVRAMGEKIRRFAGLRPA